MKIVLGVRDLATRPYINTGTTVMDGREVNAGIGPFYFRLIIGRLRARSASDTCRGGASDAERKAPALLVSECNERTVNESETDA